MAHRDREFLSSEKEVFYKSGSITVARKIFHKINREIYTFMGELIEAQRDEDVIDDCPIHVRVSSSGNWGVGRDLSEIGQF